MMSPLYLAAMDYLLYILNNNPKDVELFSELAERAPFTNTDINPTNLVELDPDTIARKYSKWYVTECVLFTWGERQLRFSWNGFSWNGNRSVNVSLCNLKDKWLGNSTFPTPINLSNQLHMNNVMGLVLTEERKRVFNTLREVQKYHKSQQKYDTLKELWNINPRT